MYYAASTGEISSSGFVLLEMFALKIISILLLYDVDLWLKCSEKPSENLLDTRESFD